VKEEEKVLKRKKVKRREEEPGICRHESALIETKMIYALFALCFICVRLGRCSVEIRHWADSVRLQGIVGVYWRADSI